MSLESQLQDLRVRLSGDCHPALEQWVEDMVFKAAELETLVRQAHEFMTGEWEPDDVDRHRFVERLERAIR